MLDGDSTSPMKIGCFAGATLEVGVHRLDQDIGIASPDRVVHAEVGCRDLVPIKESSLEDRATTSRVTMRAWPRETSVIMTISPLTHS